MQIIKQSVEIVDLGGHPIDIYKKLEKVGRVCYKSEDRITDTTHEKFLADIIKRGHESVLEHHNITLKFITDRGVTHEMVRHRIASYSQESTRYVNYNKVGMEVILPVEFVADITDVNKSTQYWQWMEAMKRAEAHYNAMIKNGAAPQLARAVLPNSLKTEIVMTANIREWRHFFKLRTASGAHPQMRALAKEAQQQLGSLLPILFEC